MGSTTTASDLTYSLALPLSDTTSSTSPSPQQSELPTGSATLSLIALYDGMSDVDFLTAAWWYRLTPPSNADLASDGQLDGTMSQNMLTSLELAQHGFLLRALDVSLDILSNPHSLSTPGTPNPVESSNTVSTASLNRAAAVAAAAAAASSSCSRANTPSNSISQPSLQLGEIVNRTRLHDYCIRYVILSV